MRSPGCVVVDESQIGIDLFGDGRRSVISILFASRPDTGVVQRFGPWVLCVGKRLLLPGQLGFFQNDVDAMTCRPQRFPFSTPTAPEWEPLRTTRHRINIVLE